MHPSAHPHHQRTLCRRRPAYRRSRPVWVPRCTHPAGSGASYLSWKTPQIPGKVMAKDCMNDVLQYSVTRPMMHRPRPDISAKRHPPSQRSLHPHLLADEGVCEGRLAGVWHSHDAHLQQPVLVIGERGRRPGWPVALIDGGRHLRRGAGEGPHAARAQQADRSGQHGGPMVGDQEQGPNACRMHPPA